MPEGPRAGKGFLGRGQRAPSPPARDVGERCKLPNGVLGGTPENLKFGELETSKYRVGQKKVSLRCLHITSSNNGRFSKFFHCHILQEICNIAIIKYRTSPQTCCYTTL